VISSIVYSEVVSIYSSTRYSRNYLPLRRYHCSSARRHWCCRRPICYKNS